MIRINKPPAPDTLTRQATTDKTDLFHQQYVGAPHDYVAGTKRFKFESKIYGHAEVKQLLIKAQRDKCCFCENIIADSGDVEHFRPKSAYKQKAKEGYTRPGYYWLAYDWSNLMLSCSTCNQRHKKNLFPLLNPAARANPIDRDISREEPLFINPAVEDPALYITFEKERAVAVNKDRRSREAVRAKTTIDSLKLNRKQLLVARLEKFRLMKQLRDSVRLAESIDVLYGDLPEATREKLSPNSTDVIQGVKKLFDEARDGKGSYSAMVQAALQHDFWEGQTVKSSAAEEFPQARAPRTDEAGRPSSEAD